MKIKISPFPVVFVSAICEKHDCRVIFEGRNIAHPTKQNSSQVQMTVNYCEVGGNPLSGGCEDKWVMFLNGPGSVTVMS